MDILDEYNLRLLKIKRNIFRATTIMVVLAGLSFCLLSALGIGNMPEITNAKRWGSTVLICEIISAVIFLVYDAKVYFLKKRLEDKYEVP